MNTTFFESGIKRTGILAECKSCGKDFLTRKDRPRLYCSIKCRGRGKSEINSVDVICAQCGHKFIKSFSKLKHSKSGLYFCTRKCKNEAQKIGGIKEIMPPHYGTSNGRESCRHFIESQERAVCGCGESKRYLLCVHHIDGNRNNNVLENFEIVCWNCHVKRHLRFDEVKEIWVYSQNFLTPRDKLNEV